MKIVRPKMFIESEPARVKNIILQILIFYAVFLVIALAEAVVPFIFMFSEILAYFESGQYTGINEEYFKFIENLQYQDKFMIITLISTVFGTLLAMIYCRFIEKRPLSSMGFTKKNGLHDYLIGMLIGFAMLTSVVLLNILFGAMSFDGLNKSVSIGIILLYLVGFIIQGMSEEVIFRGYLMNSIGGKHSMTLAVLISSGAFSLAHILNPGVTFLGIVNIMLFGIFMGLYMICFDNIWGASAIHSIWNFSQGNIFGISVSGTGSIQTVLYTSADNSKALINGGNFGVEGGLVSTIVLVIACILLFMYMKKKEKIA